MIQLAILALAQGVLVDDGATALRGLYAVDRQTVTVTIRDQVAGVVVEQMLSNVAGADASVRYLFPVPTDASVSGFSVRVGDRALAGELVGADAARGVLLDVCRAKKETALLSYTGQRLFRTEAFALPKGEERRLRVSYTELLKADAGLVKFHFPLAAARFSNRPIARLEMRIDVEAKGDIKTVYSPTHAAVVSRADEHRARADYAEADVLPEQDFRLFYGVDDAALGANLISFKPDADGEGAFLLLASPKVAQEAGEAEPKDIVFVLDRSGSMQADGKIEQAREALMFVLRSLNAGDRFTVLTFSNTVEAFSDALLEYTPENKAAALERVRAIDATGGTDINSAMLRAIECFDKAGERMRMILFLTDGLPTVGETDIDKITANLKKANTNRIRMFEFGVGGDVNTTLLDRIADQNHGMSENIEPGANLETFVSNYYKKIQAPVLSDVKFDFGGVEVFALNPRRAPDLFAGGQLAIAGRYKGAGPTTVTVSGTTRGREVRYAYEVIFDAHSPTDEKLFVERIWATREIGHIVDMIQLYGESDELVHEIVELSTRYGIITEYTAFLTAANIDVKDRESCVTSCKEALKGMKEGGDQGMYQAMDKKERARAQQTQTKSQWRDADGKVVTADGVQSVGRKTFYKKEGVWRDLELPEKAETREVALYSDAFFRLLEEKPALAKYVTTGEPTRVEFEGVVYAFTE